LCGNEETISGIVEEREIDERTRVSRRKAFFDEYETDYEQRQTDECGDAKSPGKV
jgi:hypothetical protein